MNKTYARINWENYPSEATPLNEANLNKIDYATNEIDNRVISLDTSKLDKTTANGMVKNVTYNSTNGVFTVTYLNGTTASIDTKLEKMAVNFVYDAENERLVITLDDGTKQYVDMKSLITQYEFNDSDSITFSILPDGKVQANVKNGSITADKLQPNYLAEITVQAGIAQQGAIDAEGSAMDAEASALRAEEAAERAENVTDISIATNEKAGIVKGNVNEISIAVDGKMSVTSSFTPQEELTEVTGTENKRTLFGKIAKAISDLIAHIANTSIHFSLTNNLLSTIPGTALDAVQGKELDTRVTANTTDIDTLNRKLFYQCVDFSRFKSNLLSYDSSGLYAEENKTVRFASTASNAPISDSTFRGLWKLNWFGSNEVMVELIEFLPVAGRRWTNYYYNSSWSGWKSVTPQ